MSNRTVIYELEEWATARKAFAVPLVSNGLIIGESKSLLVDILGEVEAWNSLTSRYLERIPSKGVTRRFNDIGHAVSKGIRLRQKLDTQATARLVAEEPNREIREQFVATRTELKRRLEVLADIAVEAMIKVDMALPSEVGNFGSLLANSSKFAELLGGKRFGPIHTGIPGTALGAFAIFFRERKHVAFVIGHHLRNAVRRSGSTPEINRLNKRYGGRLLDKSRHELLLSVYKLLDEHGLTQRSSDELILEICTAAEDSGVHAWKALVAARDLIRHAELSPAKPTFADSVATFLADDLAYTHTPGREWIVRDYALARQLLTADSKLQRDSDSIILSQAGASIAPGAVGSYKPLLKLAGHYLLPVKVYSDSIVSTTGDDHRRHRMAFKDFFRKQEVLERGDFIQATAESLVDKAIDKARRNKNQFDYKNDLTNQFPIRIICHFLGIPEIYAEEVQQWTVELVRSLDAGAGLDLETLKRGNTSAREYYSYLNALITDARHGYMDEGIIPQVCETDLQTHDELLANLVTLTFAGFETTTGLLTMGTYELLKRPDQLAWLRTQLVDLQKHLPVLEEHSLAEADIRWMVWAHTQRSGRVDEHLKQRYENLLGQIETNENLQAALDAYQVQEAALANCVEEMLRWTTPGSVIPLTAEETFEMEAPEGISHNGCPMTNGSHFTVKKGDTVMVELGPANKRGCPMGEGRFSTGQTEFDITRSDNNRHLSFGVSHICIGADLAVENSKRMIEQVLRKIPTLRLAKEPDESDGQLFFTFDQMFVEI